MNKKPSKKVIKLARKYKVKISLKRGSKRFYKSEKLILKQVKKKMRKNRKVVRKTRRTRRRRTNRFGNDDDGVCKLLFSVLEKEKQPFINAVYTNEKYIIEKLDPKQPAEYDPENYKASGYFLKEYEPHRGVFDNITLNEYEIDYIDELYKIILESGCNIKNIIYIIKSELEKYERLKQFDIEKYKSYKQSDLYRQDQQKENKEEHYTVRNLNNRINRINLIKRILKPFVTINE
jgi:hypothetical protein